MSPSFAEVGVPADLVSLLARRGIDAPFAIQAATIPDALEGRDVSGKAPTGSGKTLAFGIPVVVRVKKAKSRRPRALILTPTRELASQVANELKALSTGRGHTVAAFYGGTGYEPQRRVLNSGCEIVVACPGRLEDLIQSGAVDLSDVDIVVVDEADRMADMGFLPAVKRLLDQVKPDRQTLLFSATLDGEIDVLVKRYQRKPVRHELEVQEADKGDVTHEFWKAEREVRVELTAELVKRQWPAIVFCRTRHGADRLAKQLERSGVASAAIHGNRSQGQRERALADFTSSRVQALVATDVAARGIHVDDVACVVHFDPPADEKDYVHRSGRTGRAGATGLVVTMVGGETMGAVRRLQKSLGYPQGVQAPDLAGEIIVPAKPAPRPAPTGDRRGQEHRSWQPGKPKSNRAGRPGGQRTQHSSGSARPGQPQGKRRAAR